MEINKTKVILKVVIQAFTAKNGRGRTFDYPEREGEPITVDDLGTEFQTDQRGLPAY